MPAFPNLNPGIGLLDAPSARSIALVVARFGNAISRTARPGTGFLIARKAGRCYLATAGHVLFHHGRGEFPAEIEVWLGRDGAHFAHHLLFVENVADRCFVPPEFENGDDGDRHVDIGLIRIDEALPAFDFFPSSSALPASGTAKLVGYPQAASGRLNDRPFHKIVELIERGDDNFDYAQTFDHPGLSGSPLIGQSSTNALPRVFGVHTRGSPETQRAVRLSPAIRALLRGWIDQR